MIEKYSTENLVICLKKGDEKAFEVIFQQNYRPLTLFAVKYVNNIEEAKEITQEFFIRLWSGRKDLEIKSLKTYLYRGVRNACLNHIESAKVSQRRMKDFESPSTTNNDALNNMLAAEKEAEIMYIIDKLPPKCKKIFLMSRMDQLSNIAIADQLQISVKTVEAQMSIALKRLRDVLLAFIILNFFA